MKKNYPMSAVPNLQGFPEAGYPVQAYYGLGSTLADVSAGTASGDASGGNSGLQSLASPYNFRTLAVAFLLILGALSAWHYVNVKGIL